MKFIKKIIILGEDDARLGELFYRKNVGWVLAGDNSVLFTEVELVKIAEKIAALNKEG